MAKSLDTIRPDVIELFTEQGFPEQKELDKGTQDISTRALNTINLQSPERNTIMQAWYEVPREKDISIIGDSHGNFEGFKLNLKALDLIDENNNWIGGNKNLVIMGDILFDRNAGGMDILLLINKLKSQAQENGGRIVVIKGNHDEWADGLFIDKKTAGDFIERIEVKDVCLMKGHQQGFGIIELLQYDPKIISEIKKLIARSLSQINKDNMRFEYYIKKIDLHSSEILLFMREDEKGRKILEEMVKTQIIEWIDDNLFTHTNPTRKMMQYIIKNKGIDKANHLSEKVLRYYLLGEGEQPLAEEMEKFNEIRDAFLYTDNRENFKDHKIGEQLRKMGVNAVFYGHSTIEDEKIKNDRIGGVELVPTDFGAFKIDAKDQERSVAEIDSENGAIYSGANLIYEVRHRWEGESEKEGVFFQELIADIDYIYTLSEEEFIIELGSEEIFVRLEDGQLLIKGENIISTKQGEEYIVGVKEENEEWISEWERALVLSLLGLDEDDTNTAPAHIAVKYLGDNKISIRDLGTYEQTVVEG